MILTVNDLFKRLPRRRHELIDRLWDLNHVPQRRRRGQDPLIRNVHIVYLRIGHCAVLVVKAYVSSACHRLDDVVTDARHLRGAGVYRFSKRNTAAALGRRNLS